MMAKGLHWYPFFCDDYLHDTYDLDCCEHGIYHLLLHRFWLSGPLKDDLDVLCRVAAGAPPQKVRGVLERFWVLTETGWINPRMQELRLQQIDVNEKKRKNAVIGWEKRKNPTKTTKAPMQVHEVSTCTRNENQNQSQNQNQKQSQRGHPCPQESVLPSTDMSGQAPTPRPKRVSAADVDRVLGHLNAKAGTSFARLNGDGKEGKNAQLVRDRIREHGVEALLAVIERKTEQWLHSDKMRPFLRPATLFGAQKCEQYIGECARDAGQDFLDWVAAHSSESQPDDDAIETTWSREL